MRHCLTTLVLSAVLSARVASSLPGPLRSRRPRPAPPRRAHFRSRQVSPSLQGRLYIVPRRRLRLNIDRSSSPGPEATGVGRQHDIRGATLIVSGRPLPLTLLPAPPSMTRCSSVAFGRVVPAGPARPRSPSAAAPSQRTLVPSSRRRGKTVTSSRSSRPPDPRAPSLLYDHSEYPCSLTSGCPPSTWLRQTPAIKEETFPRKRPSLRDHQAAADLLVAFAVAPSRWATPQDEVGHADPHHHPRGRLPRRPTPRTHPAQRDPREYFGIPYPSISSQHRSATPSLRALENPGLITKPRYPALAPDERRSAGAALRHHRAPDRHSVSETL